MKEGKCQMCSKIGKMSFEHWPPKSCYNKTKMLIQNYDEVISGDGKGNVCKKGFGRYTLCEECNNYTSKYVEEFKKFVETGYLKIQSKTMISKSIYPTKFENFSPLYVLKCIVSGFMSSDENLKNDTELLNFILDNKCETLPEKYRFFIYYHDSKSGKHNGYSMIADLKNEQHIHCHEISFLPFGYFMTYGQNCPSGTNMEEITFFKNYKFKEKDSFGLHIPYLKPLKNDAKIFSGMYE